MKKIIVLFLFFFTWSLRAQNWSTEDEYVQKFAKYAVIEMEKYQIPASITLAQGLLETGGGQSRLAKQGNNHFGIKCKAEWTGKSMSHTDDAPNECFRVYDSPQESYEDHSKFLRYRAHYSKLFQLDPKDYRAWAVGLKKAGYATNPKYAQILISKIEKHKLYEFDNIKQNEVSNALQKLYPNSALATNITKSPETTEQDQEPPTQKVFIKVEPTKSDAELLKFIPIVNHPNDNLRYIVLPAKTNLAFISQKFGIKESKLKKWNDLENNSLPKADIIFLEKKANDAVQEFYKVKSGDTMQKIAQKFAVKLKKLYSKNRMEMGDQPKTGTTIYLINKKPRN